jgi:hypothetical protein
LSFLSFGRHQHNEKQPRTEHHEEHAGGLVAAVAAVVAVGVYRGCLFSFI